MKWIKEPAVYLKIDNLQIKVKSFRYISLSRAQLVSG